jgi:oxygen-independent coproporphyrinogen-3 oxidase
MTAIAPACPERPPASDEPAVGNYFVAAYPPFSCWVPSQIHAVEEALLRPAPNEPLGIYVHIPFCQKKCDYCYFLSSAGASYDGVNHYLETVTQELALYTQRPAVNGRPLSFVYIGGGTPSILTPYQVRCLGDGLQRVLPWKNVKEVTFECAPRSVRPDLLESLLEIGVTRISMGVQSFDNKLLRINGRIHLVQDVLRAYALLKEMGFGWINLDLMVGLMEETWANWQDSVRRMIELGPDSVTIYQTEIPYNTQLYRQLEAGCLPATPVPWKLKRARLQYAFEEFGKAGYTVVSGYSMVKDPARHRFLYQHELWRGGDMIGLGVASFSYFGGVHFQNEVALGNYEAKVRNKSLPLQRAFRLTDHNQMVREFILQLKRGEVSAGAFQTKFAVDIIKVFARPLQSLADEGFSTYDERGVRLTPEGLLRVDRLLPRFYEREVKNIRYT